MYDAYTFSFLLEMYLIIRITVFLATVTQGVGLSLMNVFVLFISLTLSSTCKHPFLKATMHIEKY